MLININLEAEASQTALLEGLDIWLRLGLVSEAQVKQLCQEYLAVPLPVVSIPSGERSPTAPDFVPEPPPARRTLRRLVQTAAAKPEPAHQPGLMSRLVQSFLAEISVIWLLFLGVFMVVVSSGVLAASQWRNFSPVGQYGILLTYTLAFWGTSLWVARQSRLRLTARMLSIATLLIIPVNFWMMDGLNVWQSVPGLLVVAIAALVLTAITLHLLRLPVGLPQPSDLRLTAINAIGLSWLHWGWDGATVPLIASYIGTVGTAFCLTRQLNQRSRQSDLASDAAPSANDLPPSLLPTFLSLGTVAIAFSTLLLLGRAMFGAQVPLHQLGLAFGICGWLLCWLSRPTLNRVIWDRVGAGLLLWGWLISVVHEPPWQAIAVSGLGLWLLWDRFKLNWKRWELTALLLIGFQMFWLAWFVLPLEWRQGLIFASERVIRGDVAEAQLGSLGWFPYVVLMVGLATQLRRWQKPALATHTELMALILGAIATSLGITVPVLRSLNLLCSALTLTAVLRSRTASGGFLVYLTHATWLAALISGVNLLLPTLTNVTLAQILLGIVVVEWSLSFSLRHSIWRRSAWHLGLAVAAIAYLLLLASTPLGDRGLVWLAAPAMLTVVAARQRSPQPRLAAWLTIPALLFQAPLLTSLNGWLIALGIAAVLTLLNSLRVRQVAIAAFTVGFALMFIVSVIWRFFAEQLTAEILINLMAIAPFSLWLLWDWLNRRNTRFRTIYATYATYAAATDGWAIVLWVLAIGALVLSNLISTLTPNALSWATLLASVVVTLAVSYRTWRQPNEFGFWAVAVGLQVCVASGVFPLDSSAVYFAIATLALGMVTQLLGDWQVSHSGQPYRLSWHGIPLAYAGLGAYVAHYTFTATTGLYTLAAALIVIGVGRRLNSLQPLTYLALIGISVAAYELLIYQLQQASGGIPGDGVTLLAGLATSIAIGDRVLSRWLLPYLRVSQIGLQTVAHLHWAVGSTLLPLALAVSLSPTGATLWVCISIVLAVYALTMGKEPSTTSRIESSQAIASNPQPSTPLYLATADKQRDIWTYAGIVEAIAALTYALYRLAPDVSFLVDWGAVIACGVAIAMHRLPWNRWGWSLRPWQQSALLLPGTVVLLTSWGIALQSLLMVGAFYAGLAKARGQIRLSYISIVFLNWALLRFLQSHELLEPIWIATAIGSSLLYIVQVDPDLQPSTERDKRHLLRMLATGLICLTALYQAEIETQAIAILFAVLTLVLSIGLVVAGLVLRVRAFLYIGTATFIIRVLRLLWLFINTYSLLLWAVGIVLGLIFIWIAATFEARRSQVNALVQYWLTELDSWE